METESDEAIWNRLLGKDKLGYPTYTRVGDSKGYVAVHEQPVYGDRNVVKDECIGHVQK